MSDEKCCDNCYYAEHLRNKDFVECFSRAYFYPDDDKTFHFTTKNHICEEWKPVDFKPTKEEYPYLSKHPV